MFYNVECLLSRAWGESARPTGVFFFGGGELRFADSWRRITPNAVVSLAHARVGEVDRVEFAMEFVVRMFMAEEAGTRRRAILRRT